VNPESARKGFGDRSRRRGVPCTLTHDDAGIPGYELHRDDPPCECRESKLLAAGEAAPGAGTMGSRDAQLTSFGTPGTDDGANLAFLAKWTSATDGKGLGYS